MKVESGFYHSPRWTWEILDCAMPMTFDTYSNCAFQCVYCFSYFQRALGAAGEDYLAHKVRAVDVEKVKRMFTDPDKYARTFAWYIKQRMVLQWGGLSDGFDWYERKLRKSLELMRFFREIDYPVSISTKATWFLDDPEYVEVFRGAKNVHVKISIITADAENAKKLEAGTPTPQERFDALARLKELGVGWTTWRFRPLIIGESDRTMEQGFKMAKAAGVDSATTEFLCLERRSTHTLRQRVKVISEIVGYDVWDFYVKNSPPRAGLMRLNYDVKRPIIERALTLADSHGIPLFISDAHHKEKSAGTGCCGLPDTGPLSAINRGQFAEAIQIARREGMVRWSDIAGMAEPLKNIPWSKAEGYNQGNSLTRARQLFNTMFDFMHGVWNDTDSGMSPARYFGGALVPSSIDEHGDVVYVYNRPFVEDGVRVKSVNELLVKMKEDLKDDGRPNGHVAYAVVLDATNRAPADFAPFHKARLNVLVIVMERDVETIQRIIDADLDYIALDDGETLDEQLRAENLERAWLVGPAYEGNGSIRAVLSEAEVACNTHLAQGITLWEAEP